MNTTTESTETSVMDAVSESPTTTGDTPTSTYIPVTKEQVREVLVRLKWWAYHDYGTAAGVKRFEDMSVTHEGRTFSLFICENGTVGLRTTDGLTVIYEPRAMVHPVSPGKLFHVHLEYLITNRRDLSEDDLKWAQDASVFVLSYFQRNIAFGFLCNMQDSTMDGYAATLANMTNTPPETSA